MRGFTNRRSNPLPNLLALSCWQGLQTPATIPGCGVMAEILTVPSLAPHRAQIIGILTISPRCTHSGIAIRGCAGFDKKAISLECYSLVLPE
jgi:hypothetical protein